MNNPKNIVLMILFITALDYSQSIDSTLHRAYKHNSKILIDEFFMNWEISNRLRDNELLRIHEIISANDTLREIYEIVNSFYYSPVPDVIKYFVAADTLNYMIWYNDEVPNYFNRSGVVIKSSVIGPFIAEPTRSKADFVYLNDKYLRSMFDFFKCPSDSIDKVRADYKAKVAFLKDYIQILNKGNIYLPYLSKHTLLSDPILENIMINQKLDKAVIYYSMGCALMESEWKKDNERWINVRTTCIAIC
jgi:hypothetical protein